MLIIIPEREIEIIKETRSPLGVHKLADGYLEALALLDEKEKEIERLKKKASPYCDGGGGEVGEAE